MPEPEEDGSSAVWEIMSATAAVPVVPPSLPMGMPGHANTLRRVTPGNISIQEWGQKKITWGKKHPGRSFAETFHRDPGYLKWCSDRYNSLMPEQQEFVDYCRLKLEIDAES